MITPPPNGFGEATPRQPTGDMEEQFPSGVSRIRFLTAQSIHVLLLIPFLSSGNIWIFTLSGLICVVNYVYLIWNEIPQSRLVATPILLFFLSGIIRLGLVPFWALACEITDKPDAFLFTRYLVRDFIIEGQFLLVFGDLLFIAGYSAFQWKNPAKPIHFNSLSLSPGRVGYAVLLIALPFIAGNLFYGDKMASFGRIGNYFNNLGVIAALLLMILSRRTCRPVPLAVIVLVTGLALMNSLGSYMKSETLLFLMPFGLVLVPIIHQRLSGGISGQTWLLLTGCGLFFVAGLSWMFTFSQIRRAEFWVGDSDTKYILDRSEVAIWPAAKTAASSILPWTPEFQEYQQLPNGGIWAVFMRQADALAAGWSFHEKEAGATMDGKLLHAGLISLIPRVLWADKPEISHGRTVAVILGQAESEESATTATHLGGMAPALYLDLGWPWLIAGMTLSGVLFALVSHIFLHRLLINPFAAIACVDLFVESIRHFESGFAAGIDTYAYPLIVILPLAWAWDIVFPNNPSHRYPPSSHA